MQTRLPGAYPACLRFGCLFPPVVWRRRRSLSSWTARKMMRLCLLNQTADQDGQTFYWCQSPRSIHLSALLSSFLPVPIVATCGLQTSHVQQGERLKTWSTFTVSFPTDILQHVFYLALKWTLIPHQRLPQAQKLLNDSSLRSI